MDLLNADKGTFNQLSNEILLESNIEIYTEAGEKNFAELAYVNINDKIINFKKNVKYQDTNIFISADESIINNEFSNIKYYGNVKSKIKKINHMNKFLILLFILLIPFLKVSKASEILISSEELIITNDPLTTTFIDNVYASDEEIKPWSDKILIIYTEKGSQIDTIKSFGSTKLIRENQEILSENMIYFVIDKKCIKGNITLIQDGNVITGMN